MPANVLGLKRWSFSHPRWRRETLDQLDTIESLVRSIVVTRVATYANEPALGDLCRRAEQRAFSDLLRSFLSVIPDRRAGRRIWELAVRDASLRHAIPTHREIFTDWPVGEAFHDRFAFHRTAHERRERRADPAIVAFGYLIERRSREDLESLVAAALAAMPELQEVSPRAAPASSPFSS